MVILQSSLSSLPQFCFHFSASHCFGIDGLEYRQPTFMLEPLECHNFSFTACARHTQTHIHLNQFVPQSDEEVIYPPLKMAKKERQGINCRPITELAKPCLTGTNTWQGPHFSNTHSVEEAVGKKATNRVNEEARQRKWMKDRGSLTHMEGRMVQ